MTNRLFGIEIEFINAEASVVAEKMRAAGVECQTENYNHNTRRHWKIVTDSSVADSSGRRGTGLELVSPPLSGEEGKRELEIACKALNEAGAKVNNSCGLHIHHDATNFTVDAFKKLYAVYIRFEDALDTLMPASRRNDENSYCKGFKREQQGYLDAIRGCATVNDIQNVFGSRYCKLNCQSYTRHSTIEFRQHAGTTNFTKIWNWLVLTQTMVETAVSGSVTIPKQASKMSQKWFDFKKIIKGYKWMGASEELQAAIEFFNKRRTQLAKEMGIELAA